MNLRQSCFGWDEFATERVATRLLLVWGCRRGRYRRGTAGAIAAPDPSPRWQLASP